MATNISTWRTGVSNMVPKNCLSAIVDREVLNTVRHFCANTQLWREQLTAINIVAATASYNLVSTGDVCAVIHVEVDETAIDAVSEADLDARDPEWRHSTSSRSSYFIAKPGGTSAGDFTITLVYTPSEALTSGLVVHVAIMPATSATTVEDWIYNLFWEPIANGARARLYGIMGQAWTDINLSRYYDGLYRSQLADAAMERHNTFANKRLMVKQRWWL